MTNRILFLDINGVLNTQDWIQHHRGEASCNHIDPQLLDRLHLLVARSGAKVVLSSSWRLHYPLRQMEKILKLRLLDQTPQWARREFCQRGHEIQDWLDGYNRPTGEPASIVILDDDDDMVHLNHRLVQTSFAGPDAGLQERHVTHAFKLFGVD